MAKDLTKMFTELKEDLKKEVRALKDSFDRDIRADLREVKTSMDFMNGQFELMKKKLDEVLKENVALKKENEGLRQTNADLQKEMKECQTRLLLCEQYTRNVNLEIKGIPKCDNEQLGTVLTQIGEIIGESITHSDIEVCHRVPTRIAGESNIIVQFLNRRKRDTVLEKAKKRRITSVDLGLSPALPVFVNEHLCPALKRLLGKAIGRKREFHWKFVWAKNGKIFARKSDSTPIVQLVNEDDLVKIC
ncbi:hypothetical protein ISCGN_005991 [Ixodes scapularis]